MNTNKYSEEELKLANQTITLKLKEACNLITECENLADKYSLEFNWSVEYGLGGTYCGVGKEDPDDWYSSGEDNKLEQGVWYSSSQSC